MPSPRLIPDRFHAGMRFLVVDGLHRNAVGMIASIDFDTEVIEIKVGRGYVQSTLDQVTLVDHEQCDCGTTVKEIA